MGPPSQQEKRRRGAATSVLGRPTSGARSKGKREQVALGRCGDEELGLTLLAARWSGAGLHRTASSRERGERGS